MSELSHNYLVSVIVTSVKTKKPTTHAVTYRTQFKIHRCTNMARICRILGANTNKKMEKAKIVKLHHERVILLDALPELNAAALKNALLSRQMFPHIKK